MNGNLLIVHGGGPTAVLNSSLYGVLKEAQKHSEIGTVYGALGGTGGVLAGNFYDFSQMRPEMLELLKQTPATIIGTSRKPLESSDYEQMIKVFKQHKIKYVLLNGGNGSMDACGKLYRAAWQEGIAVVGIPKTVDNDLSVTDHCPGFGSAARYIAQTVAEISEDVHSLPIHVCIIESMGRNAGWITAASALATSQSSCGPDLICLPEVAFHEDRFLAEVESLYQRQGCAVVVASEGLKNEDGSPVVKPVFQVGRSVYFGNVGEHLAGLVIKKLGIKARSEKPGLAGRSSILYQSPTDSHEASLAGAAACKAAVEGKTGIMIGFERLSSEPYRINLFEIPIEDVMLQERKMPEEFIAGAYGVTPEFLDWCRPLLGGPLLQFARLNKESNLI
ncbi:diphosphate--fructose-6-phosphate 1-phosphotransferase [Desulfosporosinus sp. PR]|uniref:diphosphate--fructose-6-phosphate 1-phosphotransferase n=1 Tax=Candidatus Desulfosporosinus nitrosoreducens TaxID=3401928 RepID=UPI0027EAA9DC|nr:diphosphate--fructose-6-phosphate 1-phosphotransferase [Desulfosporosinus sp. PR]MDQ7092828.1 diphosphate--fructose-6-phosphate 1-phosphotransferase [Desulfosporosinus sp. PR]